MKYMPFFWSTLWQFFLKKRETGLQKSGRKVVFENNGKSGDAIYSDGNRSIKFYTEAGGGNCIFYISIPSEEQWEKQTGYPLESRKEILQFIADKGLKKQVRLPGAFYKLNETSIVFSPTITSPYVSSADTNQ